MSEASRIVSSALLGLDIKTAVVAGKVYVIPSPTIRRIAGAAGSLSDLDGVTDVASLIRALPHAEGAARAFSWFVAGDESLTDELAAGTPDELAAALSAALSLIDTRGFLTLSALARSVTRLAANPVR